MPAPTCYLILETNRRVHYHVRTTLPLHESVVRSAMEDAFPGRTIIPPGTNPGGPVQVVNAYAASDRDGRARLTQLQQWGVV